jgi:hypothetical protein
VPAVIDLPPVVGDPAGMRALAAQLRGDAQMVAVVAAHAASLVDGLEFFGPAADRIDGSVRSSTRQAGSLADQLLSVASLLERSASDVEWLQACRERELEKLRRELAPKPGSP